jgi:hypothetical protein
VSVGWEVCPPDSRLVDAYEKMRCWAGGEGPGRAGYQLLRYQGLAAWIEAFSGCWGAVEREASSSGAEPTGFLGASMPCQPTAAGGWTVPRDLYPELTGLLAGLAMSQLEEGVC